MGLYVKEKGRMKDFRIAIIEDSDKDAQVMRESIERYFQTEGGNYEIKRFAQAGAFFDKWVSYFDIIMMDIDMPGINGLEASRMIRKTNSVVRIIFVTNFAQYAVDGYEVNAFDFILKPIEYQNFCVRFKRALSCVENRSRNISIHETNSVVTVVPISSIYYVEVFEHQIIWHTNLGDFLERSSLMKVEEQLTGCGFYKCKSCYLVNLRFVEKLENDSVIVAGKRLEVSRRKKKEFMTELAKYYSEGI